MPRPSNRSSAAVLVIIWPPRKSLGEDLESFTAYDHRLLAAAHANGLRTARAS